MSPGVLHICHNMALAVDTELSLYNDWLPGFKAVSTLLHHEHLRKQLVGRCIKGSSFEWMEGLFTHGVSQPASWRWGSVAKILPKILSRKMALQAVWNQQRFLGGTGAQRRNKEPRLCFSSFALAWQA